MTTLLLLILLWLVLRPRGRGVPPGPLFARSAPIVLDGRRILAGVAFGSLLLISTLIAFGA